MEIIAGILHDAGIVLFYSWWFWLFIIIAPLFMETWLFWRQESFKHSIDFVFLELRMPREVRKSPMAMEQVLAAMHALRNSAGDFKEKFIDGEITRWFSLELVSLGGEVHFYVRAPRSQKNLIEAAFFSYYPDVEVVEVDDYMNNLPENITEVYKSGYEVWGTELILAKHEAYPIKSYLDFESPEEEKQYDPISLFLEILGKVKREEFVGIQFEIAPAGEEWKAHGQHVVDELRSKKKEGGHKPSAALKMEFPHVLPVFPVEGHEAKEDSEFSRMFMRTPGETDVLKAVEENLAKPGFETVVRFIYLSPKELFTDTFARRGVIGGFNQYASGDLNSFKQNQLMSTRTKIWSWPHLFPHRRNILRKERILFNYRHREIPPHVEIGKLFLSKLLNWEHSEHIVLNTRSLATLFHPPTYLVLTAPHVKRIESRKAGPPAGLPIYGAEEELDKFR